jgi:hypothetical protein
MFYLISWCIPQNLNDYQLEYSWPTIDAFFRLRNGSIYCFQNGFLFKINSIKKNGIRVVDNDMQSGRQKMGRYFDGGGDDRVITSPIRGQTIDYFPASGDKIVTFELDNNRFRFKRYTPESNDRMVKDRYFYYSDLKESFTNFILQVFQFIIHL